MSFARQVLLSLRLIKLRRFWGSLFYPLRRDWQDQVYSDTGYGYGEGRLDQFHLAWHQEQLQLTWQQQRAYPFPYRKLQLHFHGIKLQQAWADGQEILCQGNAIEVDRFEQIDIQTASP
jgi:alpha-glucosidase